MKYRQSIQSVPSYGIGYWIGILLLAAVVLTLSFYLFGQWDKIPPFFVSICLIGIMVGIFIGVRIKIKRLAMKSEKEDG